MSMSSSVRPSGSSARQARRRDHHHGQLVQERAERAAIVAEQRVDHGSGEGRADGEREHARRVDLERRGAGGRIGIDGGRQELEHRGHQVRHVPAHDDRGRVVAPVDVGEGDEARRKPGQGSPMGDAVAHHRHLVDEGRPARGATGRPAR